MLYVWIGFLALGAIIYLVSLRIKKQTDENGIETTGVISRITDVGGADDIILHYYVKYRTQDGEEIEGLLSNPNSSLEVGQRVNVKYHPKYKTNARLIRTDR